MSEGYVKIHRKLLDNPICCKDSDYLAIWIWLLLSATHREIQMTFGGQKITLHPGQLITSRKRISSDLGVNESKVQRVLKCFESEHQIEQRTDRQSRLVFLKNWHEYQNCEQLNAQRVNNECTTSEQRVNTHKNVRMKEVNTESKDSCPKPKKTQPKIDFDFEAKKFHGIDDNLFRFWQEAYPAVNVMIELKHMVAWLIANPKNKKSQYGKFITGWLKRAQDKAPRVEVSQPKAKTISTEAFVEQPNADWEVVE